MVLTALITTNPEKACYGIPTRVHPHLPGLTLNQAANQVVYWLAYILEGEDGPRSRFPSRLFSGLVVIDAVNIIGILSDPVPIYLAQGGTPAPCPSRWIRH